MKQVLHVITVILGYYDTHCWEWQKCRNKQFVTINNLSQYNVAKEINVFESFVTNAAVLLDEELLK